MKSIVFLVTGVVVLTAATGCANKAKYIETGGRESVVTVGDINIQDFINAADAATASLLESGALDRVATPPAILVISRIVNSTSQHVDTDLLTKKIRVSLNQSGKALTSTTIGLGSEAEDPLAEGLKQEAEFTSNQQMTRPPDFSLSGKIIETRVKAGRTEQSTYSFQLSLSDNRGLAVWEGEEEITKQGKRSSVSF